MRRRPPRGAARAGRPAPSYEDMRWPFLLIESGLDLESWDTVFEHATMVKLVHNNGPAWHCTRLFDGVPFYAASTATHSDNVPYDTPNRHVLVGDCFRTAEEQEKCSAFR